MNTRRLPLTVFALAVAGLLTWNSPARASVIGTPIPVTAAIGQKFNGLVATFTDSDTGALPSDFFAVIDWGDAAVQSPGIITGSLGLLDVSGRHTYSGSGLFAVTILLSDVSGNAIAQAVGTASVTSVPEPGSIALVGAGFAAFLLRRRRKASLK
jgi:hypothetical protein